MPRSWAERLVERAGRCRGPSGGAAKGDSVQGRLGVGRGRLNRAGRRPTTSGAGRERVGRQPAALGVEGLGLEAGHDVGQSEAVQCRAVSVGEASELRRRWGGPRAPARHRWRQAASTGEATRRRRQLEAKGGGDERRRACACKRESGRHER
jgi:hypothetical protein